MPTTTDEFNTGIESFPVAQPDTTVEDIIMEIEQEAHEPQMLRSPWRMRAVVLGAIGLVALVTVGIIWRARR